MTNSSPSRTARVCREARSEPDPGSLKPEDYAAVTAYVLQQNGYPAGTTPLAKGAAGLKDAKITP